MDEQENIIHDEKLKKWMEKLCDKLVRFRVPTIVYFVYDKIDDNSEEDFEKFYSAFVDAVRNVSDGRFDLGGYPRFSYHANVMVTWGDDPLYKLQDIPRYYGRLPWSRLIQVTDFSSNTKSVSYFETFLEDSDFDVDSEEESSSSNVFKAIMKFKNLKL